MKEGCFAMNPTNAAKYEKLMDAIFGPAGHGVTNYEDASDELRGLAQRCKELGQNIAHAGNVTVALAKYSGGSRPSQTGVK